ncbi:MAG: hypothetical protein NTZ73_00030 [Candidatus Diapherotrites archaeon]|nr:hypothetical protein [Candidatus Diapherotrites archaeon]
MKKIIVIFEKLLNSKQRIMHKREILAIVKEYNKSFGHTLDDKNAIKYLSRHNYIKRIISGYYYVNSFDERNRNVCNYEDKELLFLVLNELKIKWYVGSDYALYISGTTWQLPNTITILNNKFSGIKKVVGLKARFCKIKENLFFGLGSSKTKNQVKYFYSLPAKTYLDMTYLKISNKLIRIKETKKYIKRYPKWVGMK